MIDCQALQTKEFDQTLTMRAWHCTLCQNILEEITVRRIGQDNKLKRIIRRSKESQISSAIKIIDKSCTVNQSYISVYIIAID